MTMSKNTLIAAGIVPEPVGYKWKIIRDFDYERAVKESEKTGRPLAEYDRNHVGIEGPRTADGCPAEYGDETTIRFKLYDDDKNLYCEGVLCGDWEGFEPLDDFGTANWGCVHIKVKDPQTGKWDWL
jgi:hypothetical protein